MASNSTRDVNTGFNTLVPVKLDVSDKVLRYYSLLYPVPGGERIFFGGNPIDLMHDSITDLLKRHNGEYVYSVTPKLDGVRLLLFIHPELGMYFIDRCLKVYESRDKELNKNIRERKITADQNQVFELLGVKSKEEKTHGIFLLDGEYYETTNNGLNVGLYFAFDMLYDNNEDLVSSQVIFGDSKKELTRYYRLQIFMSNEYLKDRIHQKLITHGKIYIQLKQFYELYEYIGKEEDMYESIKQVFDRHYEMKFDYDGLIFTPIFREYVIGSWKSPENIVYKWKPSEHLTIDFTIDKNAGTVEISQYFKGRKNYVPFKNILQQNNYRITDNSYNEYKDRIESRSSTSVPVFECFYDKEKDQFKIIREREDKSCNGMSNPNSKRTAISIMKLIRDPIDINVIKYGRDVTVQDRLELFGYVPSSINPYSERDAESRRSRYKTFYLNIPFLKNEIKPFFMRYMKQKSLNENMLIENNTELEFEIRIGKFIKQRFITDIHYKNFNWLQQTMNAYKVAFVYSKSVDVINESGYRTTYYYDDKGFNTTIKKTKLETKNIVNNVKNLYNFGIRLSTASEKFEPSITVDINDDRHTKRIKDRYTYFYNDEFFIDMTIVTNSNNRITREVEIEHVGDEGIGPMTMINLTAAYNFVLYNLFGKSDIL